MGGTARDQEKKEGGARAGKARGNTGKMLKKGGIRDGALPPGNRDGGISVLPRSSAHATADSPLRPGGPHFFPGASPGPQLGGPGLLAGPTRPTKPKTGTSLLRRPWGKTPDWVFPGAFIPVGRSGQPATKSTFFWRDLWGGDLMFLTPLTPTTPENECDFSGKIKWFSTFTKTEEKKKGKGGEQGHADSRNLHPVYRGPTHFCSFLWGGGKGGGANGNLVRATKKPGNHQKSVAGGRPPGKFTNSLPQSTTGGGGLASNTLGPLPRNLRRAKTTAGP